MSPAVPRGTPPQRRTRPAKRASGVDADVNVLTGDPVVALTVIVLRRFDVQAHLVGEHPGDETPHRVRLPIGCLHDLGYRKGEAAGA